jgi:hypothetical protein
MSYLNAYTEDIPENEPVSSVYPILISSLYRKIKFDSPSKTIHINYNRERLLYGFSLLDKIQFYEKNIFSK